LSKVPAQVIEVGTKNLLPESYWDASKKYANLKLVAQDRRKLFASPGISRFVAHPLTLAPGD